MAQNEGMRPLDQLQAQEAAHSEVEAAKNTAIADLNARLVSLEEDMMRRFLSCRRLQTIQDKDRYVKLATSEVSQLEPRFGGQSRRTGGTGP